MVRRRPKYIKERAVINDLLLKLHPLKREASEEMQEVYTMLSNWARDDQNLTSLHRCILVVATRRTPTDDASVNGILDQMVKASQMAVKTDDEVEWLKKYQRHLSTIVERQVEKKNGTTKTARQPKR